MKDKKSKRLILNFGLSFCILIFAFGIFSTVEAASLSISPSSGTHNVGQTFSVSVYVSSADQSMNAASGIITFPADKLQITSLSKTGSIVSLWVQEPSFSNPLAGGQGTVNFEGIVLNPGFQGSNGKIITLTFKVKTVGTASLSFTSSSVLANDGQGTNILTNIGKATYALENPAETPVAPKSETPSKTIGTPNAPEIISSTHPDPNKWYQATITKFSWQLSSEIEAIRISFDKNPRSMPQNLYSPPISSKEINDLEEGAWYFHLQLKNSYGWGDISHFRIQIDKTSPEPFIIKTDNRGDKTNPQPLLIFQANDKLSGIDYYGIKIGDIYNLKVLQSEILNGSYKIPVMPPGEYSLIIRAFDKAGNYSPAVETLTIMPIEAPFIRDCPKELTPGSPLILRGKALVKSKVTVFILNERKELISESAQSDEEGEWNFILGKTLDRGVYTIYAKTTDERGAQSEASESAKVVVNLPIFARIGNIAITYLTVIITLLALLILMAMVWLYGWKKIRDLKKTIKKETQEAESALYRGFNILKEEMAKQIAELDGKPGLSKKEAALNDGLKTALNNAEKIIGKEIKDIRKELKNHLR